MAAAAAAAVGRAVVLSQPVTFVTGNAKKLEEVRAILGNSIPFRSLKLDRTLQIHAPFFSVCLRKILFSFLCAISFSDFCVHLNSAGATRRA